MTTNDYRPEPEPGSSLFTPPNGASSRRPPVEPLCYRLRDVAEALGVSLRTIERERSAGRFPKEDRKIGKSPIWLRSTIVAWVAAATTKPAGRGVAQ